MSAAVLSSPGIETDLARDLARVARRKVGASDVDDVVQATLLELLSANARPETPEETRRFAFFVVHQKIADVHRRRARDQRICVDLEAVTAAASSAEPSDLFRWLNRVTPEKETVGRTLAWMVREAEGETLSDIARAEGIPATAVRKRVSRLRRLLRERWKRDVGAGVLVALALALTLAAIASRRSPVDIAKVPEARPRESAPAASASASSAPSCDPPYRLDPETGRRIYRLECIEGTKEENRR